MSNSKTAPAVKIFWGLALLVLILWIIPTAISYYKGSKIYSQKVVELRSLDNRKVKSEAKLFHLEMFKESAKKYFDKVDVVPTDENKYKISIHFPINSLPTFYKFFKDISLNYRILVDDNIVYEENNKSIRVRFVVKPY
jgi:flagellar biosynthesis protein FliP